MAETAAGPLTDQGNRRGAVAAIRRASLAMVVLLLIQYGLGISVNLYVKVPGGHPGIGAAFGKAITQGAPALAIHASLGLLLVLNAIVVVVQAARSRRGGVVAASVLGLAALIGAAFNGAAFVSASRNVNSLVMALLAALAILCYVVDLYLLG